MRIVIHITGLVIVPWYTMQETGLFAAGFALDAGVGVVVVDLAVGAVGRETGAEVRVG